MHLPRSALFVASCLAVGCANVNARADVPNSGARDIAIDGDRGAQLLREAELHASRARAIDVQLYALGEAKSDGTPIAETRLQALETEQRRSIDQAIAAYARVADPREIATAAERATALLRLGRALKERGDASQAQARYRELVTSFPRAPEAAAAYLALAEIAFARESLPETIEACDNAVAVAGIDDGIRVSALYLKAWSLRGLADSGDPAALRRAMETLRDLVALAPAERSESSDIATSAEQELVELYAAHGDPVQANAFFDTLAHPTAARLLTALRERYKRPPPTRSL